MFLKPFKNNTKPPEKEFYFSSSGGFCDILLRNAIFFPNGKIDIFT